VLAYYHNVSGSLYVLGRVEYLQGYCYRRSAFQGAIREGSRGHGILVEKNKYFARPVMSDGCCHTTVVFPFPKPGASGASYSASESGIGRIDDVWT
jgi:hypothetical protein